MRNEEKMSQLREMHEYLLKRISAQNPSSLPKNIDMKKLEKAYESLKGYVFVLKKE
ncbi:MAG: hypothetical protein KGH98_01405 [Candidatus Micrarchaeota archaeon]|nr:hypothetical protein [Candidatus Micrarchaeota archaeon]